MCNDKTKKFSFGNVIACTCTLLGLNHITNLNITAQPGLVNPFITGTPAIDEYFDMVLTTSIVITLAKTFIMKSPC